ncbi:MAG: Nramp family divalent metal transporter [Candidatus Latescibacterota bacterium]|nr:MAG: Nramp family divalent metal transporter [Candidatus Latescibacterota bacterium]
MRRLLHILFWSVIAAAFIGPGTVTTAASSGARFGFSLLWALLFSTVACLVLQEASARVTVVSGRTLARAIRERFRRGAMGLLVVLMVLGAIVLGCAAYEAGNILGSVAGASLKTGISPRLLTLVIGFSAGLLLFLGTTQTVARILGVLVAFMGVAFLVTAVLIKPPLVALVKGTLVPTLPPGSSLLVLGLIGTTVVPYNLFLGSGIAAGQKLGELRFGLSVAIILGGIISKGIQVVGTAIASTFSFQTLSIALSQQLGEWAAVFFAIGLFAAGFSSAVTAPLAAAITAQGLFDSAKHEKWRERSWRYRGIWLAVLATGVFFGIIDVRPVPAIIIAQALNGMLLPFVAIFLFLVVNDRPLMGDRGINGLLSNVLMSVVVAVTIVLGVSKTAQAVTSAVGLPAPTERVLLVASAAIAVAIAACLARVAIRRRR